MAANIVKHAFLFNFLNHPVFAHAGSVARNRNSFLHARLDHTQTCLNRYASVSAAAATAAAAMEQLYAGLT